MKKILSPFVLEMKAFYAEKLVSFRLCLVEMKGSRYERRILSICSKNLKNTFKFEFLCSFLSFRGMKEGKFWPECVWKEGK